MKCQKKQTLLHRSQRYSLWGHLIYCLQSRYRAPNFQSPLYPKNWRNFPCSAQSCVIFQKQWSCFQHFVPMQTSRGPRLQGSLSMQDTGHRTQEDGTGTPRRAGCLSMCLHSLWSCSKPAHDLCRRQHRMGFLCSTVKVRGVLMDRSFPPSLALHLVVSICQLSNEAKQ